MIVISLAILFSLILLANAGENKMMKQSLKRYVSKPQQAQHIFSNTIFSREKNNQLQRKQEKQKIKPSLNSHSSLTAKILHPIKFNGFEMAKETVTSIRDEIVDCFDSLVYAKTNTERLDNCIEIGYRHRGLFYASAFFMVAKVGLSRTK